MGRALHDGLGARERDVRVEALDQGGVIVTLGTPDGFQVSFSLAALELLKMATQGASRCIAASGIIGN